MTEEIVKEEKEEVIEVNPVEEKASEMGWMPKEAWVEAGKDPGQWRSAELFVELEPLFGKIESLKREVRGTKQTLEAFKQHHAKVRETEYKHALEDLKTQKKLALEEGDAGAVVEIDEEIADTKTAINKAERDQIQASEIHPEFAEWVDNNSWYATNREMQAFADSLGRAYALANPTVAPQEVLKHVEKKVKQAYPDKFKNPAQSRVSSVEGAKTPAKKAEADFELNEDERRVMNKLVKNGVMSEKDYIAELKKVKGVK